ncbi:MAG TPA: DNA-processing protein DprA, partial [Candidatus Ozemobacteraceae bacterium]|nr:DNA-processing protein DprA [Candidatus Ozemobacteraceae bacterium]
MGEELEAAVTLSRLPGVGARRFIELIRAHGLPSAALAAWNASKESRVARVGPTRQKRAGPIAEWAGRARLAGATTHWAGGPGYPARLLDLSEPPPIVFLRGSWQENPDGENVRSSSEINIDPDRNLSSEDDVKKKNAIRKPSIKRLCIVGSRGAVSETIPWLRSLVTGIADNQRHAVIRWEILSGAAVGIDASAHRAALENGMRTSAVLANGIDISYPACNNILIEEIARSGGLMTELLPGAPPRRSFFPTRNRLLAALADAVIVVQAGENSGSLITAKWAM